MVTLRLLGTPALDRPDGPIAGRPAQRHRLALLALLATAPGHRLSRDKSIALLWPEAEARRARHLLNVSVHVLRKAAGKEALRSEGDDLVLAPDMLRIDSVEFERALDEGQFEEGVAIYRGPFLDGFYLEGAPAFERWVEDERARLAALHASALETLATRSSEVGDVAATVEWSRRLAAQEPYSTRYTVILMRALEAAGDRGKALQVAEAHEVLLREELDAEPDPGLAALVRRLREEPEPVVDLGADTSFHRSDSEHAHADVDAHRPRHSTPDGPGRCAAPAPEPSEFRAPRRRRLALLTLLVVLAGGGGVLALLAIAESSPPAAPSAFERTALAVLPFEYYGDETDDYLARGLHDELLTQLAKLGELSVRGRTSVMGYASTEKPVRQIARELAVGTLVDGSVRVSGERLRVTVRLVDATTDEHRWAERYDGTVEDAFAIQSEIARRIAGVVGVTLTEAERAGLTRAPTSNPEAYRLYLQGRAYHTRPGWEREKWDAAQQLYERALALDPEFALARAALSEVHGVMFWLRYDPSPARAERQRAEAEAAFRLAPELPRARRAMGLAHYWGRRDFEAAVQEFRAALVRAPGDAWTRALIGYVSRRTGDWDEAVAAFEAASRLEPRDAGLFADLGGNTYRFLHRYPEALRAYDRALTLAPDLHIAEVRRGWTYLAWTGSTDTLRAVLLRLPPDTDLGAGGTPTAQLLQLLLWTRNADSLFQVLRSTRTGVFRGQDFFLPASLYSAWAHRLRREEAAAIVAFDSAIAVLDSAVELLPDDWRVHATRGLALAGRGRHREAIAEADWLRNHVAYREDAYDGPDVAENRARILAQAGEADPALEELARLLPGPSWLSAHEVRLDPLWDPLREHPRFKRLLTRHAS